MSTIEWGPVIQHDGTGRPEGLRDEDAIAFTDKAGRSYGFKKNAIFRVQTIDVNGWWSKSHDYPVVSYCLAYDHPVYSKPSAEADYQTFVRQLNRASEDGTLGSPDPVPVGPVKSPCPDWTLDERTVEACINVIAALPHTRNAVAALRALLKPADPDEEEAESEGEQPAFLCGCVVEKTDGLSVQRGWRANIIFADGEHAALGFFIRSLMERDPGCSISCPRADELFPDIQRRQANEGRG